MTIHLDYYMEIPATKGRNLHFLSTPRFDRTPVILGPPVALQSQSFSTSDDGVSLTLCGGVCPVHFWVFCGIPGLSPLYAISTSIPPSPLQ